MYVCMYVFMYLCLYIHMYVCMYVCLYIRIYVRMYVRMYVCTYICMYVCMYGTNQMQLDIRMHAWTRALVWVHLTCKPIKNKMTSYVYHVQVKSLLPILAECNL